MNTVTSWTQEKVDDNTVRYVSEHTINGTIVVTATKENVAGVSAIVWDKPDDVPHFIHDRAALALGLPIG